MLIWINGAFGGGKTHTAFELHHRLPGSVVCDPELVGYGLQRMTPPGLRSDFQEFTSWRSGVAEVLQHTLTRHPGVVLAPMTVTRPEYLEQMLGGARADGHDVRTVTLLARRETVLRRLTRRGLDRSLRREAFAVSRLEDCLTQLPRPAFADHVWTDDLTVQQVADEVARTTGLTLTPPEPNPLRRRLRRLTTTVRHVRLG